MKTSQCFQLHQVDREDLWVSGFTFKVNNTDTYEESFDEIKEILSSSEFEKLLIDEFHLVDDLFNGDKTYKLAGSSWLGPAYFVFRNSEGEEVEFTLSADYITLVEP